MFERLIYFLFSLSGYDVAIMPPAFVYGGMENPRLTFLSPTLLAGDRSLTSVVAHEIAHRYMMVIMWILFHDRMMKMMRTSR